LKARALFCDRDGTLIRDTGYVRDPNDVELLPGVGDALRWAKTQGFLVVVISNQSGIGRGIISEPAFESVDRRFRELLARDGVTLDGAYYCPHAPDVRCGCRKPKTELVERAVRDLDIDAARSYFVGDKESDVATGLAMGCTAVFFGDGGSTFGATHSLPNWRDASRIFT
jgi:histidinol-phosphate phosphatase family protein